MSRRSPHQPVLPAALAVGLLEDGGRALFLYQVDLKDQRLLELPSVLVMPGENPVQRLAEEYAKMTGIDAQVHETIRQASINAGSRKKRHLIPVLVFRLTAKRMSARAGAGWGGFAWLAIRSALEEKFTRRGQWFVSPAMPAR
ncbi:MAG: hypothetical protein KGH63_00475 [Candidatus Micrarchaeota archaeon]|nr:hypothetical protein [Candidatus Micrarchaeota archaeon]